VLNLVVHKVTTGFGRLNHALLRSNSCIARAERDDPCAETRFHLSEKRTSPFESAGVSAQSAGRRLSVNLSRQGD
jgi:hypothetical protein